MSIGYKVALGGKEIPRSDGARLLKQIHPVEVSVVTRSMNPLAEVETVKSLGADPYNSIPVFESVMCEMHRLTRDLRS